MTEKYYSDKTIRKFIKSTLCEDDPETYRHYRMGNVKMFRKRLKNFDSVEQTVYVHCTNILRDLVYELINDLTEYMKDWGDLIITGGEAFNTYFDVCDRVVSSDIDTKFVPRFLSPLDQKFFGMLQYCKLYLWERIGRLCQKYNDVFYERLKILQKTHIGKMLGISVSKDPVCLTRRYTLIKKSKRKNVLIDVELFAFDLSLRYYSPDEKKVTTHRLGGILDIPIMRPYELGYEVVLTRERGTHVVNPITDEILYYKNIMIASKLFLIEDLYIMKSLGLRPTKLKKDRKRMITFSTKVLGIKNVTSKTSDETIFKKSIKVIKPKRITKVSKTNISKLPLTYGGPTKYAKYTSEPSVKSLRKFVLPGLKTKQYEKIDGFEKTNKNMVFDKTEKKWKISNNPYYIGNRYNFRPLVETTGVIPRALEKSLYSFKPSRNDWLPEKVIRDAAMIPLVGLKTTDLKTLVK